MLKPHWTFHGVPLRFVTNPLKEFGCIAGCMRYTSKMLDFGEMQGLGGSEIWYPLLKGLHSFTCHWHNASPPPPPIQYFSILSKHTARVIFWHKRIWRWVLKEYYLEYICLTFSRARVASPLSFKVGVGERGKGSDVVSLVSKVMLVTHTISPSLKYPRSDSLP